MNITFEFFARSFIYAVLAAVAVSAQDVHAQTQQSDYERLRQQGVQRDDAAARANGIEQERQRQQREQQEQQRQRSQSGSSSAGIFAPGDSTGSIDNSEATRREVAEARRMWEKRPPLAPNRNPLLGKWVLQRANNAGQNTLLGLLANPGAMMCPTLLGEGIIDYRENVLADGAGNALDKVQYRGNGNHVAVLGTRGVQLLVYEFNGPNQIKLAGFDCLLARAGPPMMANSQGAAPTGAPAARAPEAAPRGTAAAGGGIAGLGVKFGFTLGAVHQTLVRRQVSLMNAFNGNKYNLVAVGEFADIDPRINSVAYEFDAPENPAARLVGVVITYTRDNGGAQSVVFSERASIMSKQYPLAPQSPTRLQASVRGAIISLIDDPNTSRVFEVYRVQ